MFTFAFLEGIVGKRFARPVGLVLIALTVGILFLIVSQCHHDDTAQKQAQQTNRSGDAIATAAQSAIATIGNRTVTESRVDAAVAVAQGKIGNAANPDDIRNAVIGSLCSQAGHSLDPACRVQ